MKRLILALSLLLLPFQVQAASTAEQIQPGYLTTSGCSGGQSSCFKPYTSVNPMPVSVTGTVNADVTNSTAIPTGGTVSNTIGNLIQAGWADPRSYGATCDNSGTTDDTAAFLAAANTTKPVLVPDGCTIGDLNAPSGAVFFGFGTTAYRQPLKPTLYIKSGATSGFNTATNRRLFLQGFTINGQTGYATNGTGSGPNGVAGNGGGGRVTAIDMQFYNCRKAVGDTLGTIFFYSLRNIYEGNETGIYKVVDLQSVGDTFDQNYDGLYFDGNSSSGHVVGARVEWNARYGAILHSVQDLGFTDVQFDRNHCTAVSIEGVGTQNVTFNGGWLKRNGDTATAGCQSHVVWSGTFHQGAYFSNVQTATGVDDGGGGTLSPRYVFDFQTAGSNAQNVSFLGGTGAGFTTSFANYTSGNPTNYYVVKTKGVSDIPNSPTTGPDGWYFKNSTYNTINVSATGTVTITQLAGTGIPNTSLVQYNPGVARKLEVNCRSTGSADLQAAVFHIYWNWEFSGITATPVLVSSEGTKINFGYGPITLAINTIAGDASSFHLDITNDTANQMSCNAVYSPL